MHPFLYGLFGGIIIGISAAVLLLLSGDILGASYIVSILFLEPRKAVLSPTRHWIWVFLGSFCLTSNLFFGHIYEDKDDALASVSPAAFVVGGLLVGFGTRLGHGCTSGHGICGLARFSKRSFAAVPVFMVVGILTAYFSQEETSPLPKSATAWLRTDGNDNLVFQMWSEVGSTATMAIAFAAFIVPSFHPEAQTSTRSFFNARKKLAPSALSGVLFAAGLYVSRMVFPIYVFGFLNFGLLAPGGNSWDPTLMFVMGGGCVVSAISYQFIDKYSYIFKSDGKIKPISKPLALGAKSKFQIPQSTIIDAHLIVGAIFFGLGWGLTGLCPGPAIFLASIGVSWVLVCYWPAFLLGSYIATLVQKKWPSASEKHDCCGDQNEHNTDSHLSAISGASGVLHEPPAMAKEEEVEVKEEQDEEQPGDAKMEEFQS